MLSEPEIEVLPDPENPDGLHAVLRLNGVVLLPSNTFFRIDPVDPATDSGHDWPQGDIRPEATRLCHRGVEILLGPEIVCAPKLKPGTRVRISVPYADMSADVEWPVLSRRRAGNQDDGLARLASRARPAVPQPNSVAGESAARLEPATQSATLSQPEPTRRRTPLFLPFFIGFVAAAGLTLAVWSTLRHELLELRRPAGEAAAPSNSSARPIPSLATLFDLSETSPSGSSAAGVGLAEALKRADQNLYGAAPDAEEARYWLRHGLSQLTGQPRIKWALTQLGAIYARDASPESYSIARSLWEIAGAQGDPVALCFLGKLYEFGLGVPRDNRQALASYEKARSHGGCKDLDTAIARLRPSP